MTPEERAAQCWRKPETRDLEMNDALCKVIAYEIRAAEEAAYKLGLKDAMGRIDPTTLKAQAYEDAAKIADDWGEKGSHVLARECGKRVAETIRARAKEVCNGSR